MIYYSARKSIALVCATAEAHIPDTHLHVHAHELMVVGIRI